jgi:hypothetical protein
MSSLVNISTGTFIFRFLSSQRSAKKMNYGRRTQRHPEKFSRNKNRSRTRERSLAKVSSHRATIKLTIKVNNCESSLVMMMPSYGFFSARRPDRNEREKIIFRKSINQCSVCAHEIGFSSPIDARNEISPITVRGGRS